jgi:hypothetical protein
MSRKKISTTIYVTPEQNDKLKLLHDRTKVPVAVYIREGIDLVLRHYAHLLPGQLPLETPSTTNLRKAANERERATIDADRRREHEQRDRERDRDREGARDAAGSDEEPVKKTGGAPASG